VDIHLGLACAERVQVMVVVEAQRGLALLGHLHCPNVVAIAVVVVGQGVLAAAGAIFIDIAVTVVVDAVDRLALAGIGCAVSFGIVGMDQVVGTVMRESVIVA